MAVYCDNEGMFEWSDQEAEDDINGVNNSSCH